MDENPSEPADGSIRGSSTRLFIGRWAGAVKRTLAGQTTQAFQSSLQIHTMKQININA
jgi:hypothetical protein